MPARFSCAGASSRAARRLEAASTSRASPAITSRRPAGRPGAGRGALDDELLVLHGESDAGSAPDDLRLLLEGQTVEAGSAVDRAGPGPLAELVEEHGRGEAVAAEVAPDGAALRAEDVGEVVVDLEGDADELEALTRGGQGDGIAGPAEHHELGREREQETGLGAGEGLVGRDRPRQRLTARAVRALAGGEARDAAGEEAHLLGEARSGSAGQRLEGGGDHRVSEEERGRLVELRPHGGGAPPLPVGVLEVVVDQRSVVQQLHRDRGRQGLLRGEAEAQASGQCETPAEALAPGGEVVARGVTEPLVEVQSALQAVLQLLEVARSGGPSVHGDGRASARGDRVRSEGVRIRLQHDRRVGGKTEEGNVP